MCNLSKNEHTDSTQNNAAENRLREIFEQRLDEYAEVGFEECYRKEFCNERGVPFYNGLALGVYERGFKIGFKESITAIIANRNMSTEEAVKYLEDGIDNGKQELITDIMKRRSCTFEQAADFLGLSDSDKQRYADKV